MIIIIQFSMTNFNSEVTDFQQKREILSETFLWGPGSSVVGAGAPPQGPQSCRGHSPAGAAVLQGPLHRGHSPAGAPPQGPRSCRGHSPAAVAGSTPGPLLHVSSVSCLSFIIKVTGHKKKTCKFHDLTTKSYFAKFVILQHNVAIMTKDSVLQQKVSIVKFCVFMTKTDFSGSYE